MSPITFDGHTRDIEWSGPALDKKLPSGRAWRLSSAVDVEAPIPPGVMLGVHIGKRFCHIAPAAIVLPQPTREQRILNAVLAQKLYDRWRQNGCRPLTAEQAGTIMLGRLLLA